MMDPLHDHLRTHHIASKSLTYFEGSSFIPAQLACAAPSVPRSFAETASSSTASAPAGNCRSLAARGEVDGAVVIAPPTDLLTLEALVPANYGMSSLQAYQMSPLRRLNRRAAPTLLLHGDADSLVPYEQSQRFLVAARRFQDDVGLVTMSGSAILMPRRRCTKIVRLGGSNTACDEIFGRRVAGVGSVGAAGFEPATLACEARPGRWRIDRIGP